MRALVITYASAISTLAITSAKKLSGRVISMNNGHNDDLNGDREQRNGGEGERLHAGRTTSNSTDQNRMNQINKGCKGLLDDDDQRITQEICKPISPM